MKCIECKYLQKCNGTYFCNIHKKAMRIKEADTCIDAPCRDYEIRMAYGELVEE